MMAESIEIKNLTFRQLSSLQYPLALDIYQRPYVWQREKVVQLCSDIREFVKQPVDAPLYYMGTLLLHENESYAGRGLRRLCVIDGQQRLTTLAVLFHVIHSGALPDQFDFHYRSALSARNIRDARSILENEFPSQQERSSLVDLFQRISFTVIVVESEDLAFTFFDTQNNRGVTLAATDLLKAFHLRAIGGSDNGEVLQSHCAQLWESIQRPPKDEPKLKRADFAPVLFEKYLWRGRHWRGQKSIRPESRDSLLQMFERESISDPTLGSRRIPLYGGASNRRVVELLMLSDNGYEFALSSATPQGDPASLPFSLRQPVHKGAAFFLYAYKYSALFRRIFYTSDASSEIHRFRAFHHSVVRYSSAYLIQLYNLATLMYADQFGDRELLRFAMWLDHVLGAARIYLEYVFDKAPLRYLRHADLNLLDVIATAYRPADVIDVLKSPTHYMDGEYPLVAAYEESDLQEIEESSPVRWRYIGAVLAFYGKESFKGKQMWIDEYLDGNERYEN